MTETQRYVKLRELFPFARGATVDELIESQARLMAHAQERPPAERIWHTQEVYQAPQGATPPQDPPGDKP